MPRYNNRTYSIMAKPVSSACNLHCEYCYYTGKNNLLNIEASIMSHEVLEKLTFQNISMHGKNAVIEFAWHGGEPLLAGIEFFREAVRLQKEYGKERKIINTIQTNGTLIDEEWSKFFRDNNFLLGVSIDGREELHNVYRENSFSSAMKGIELLKKHHVPFNTLTAVNNINSQKPKELYIFLREQTDYMQFLPVVEYLPSQNEIKDGQKFGKPSGIHYAENHENVTSFSVGAEQWGKFLCEILEMWLKYDIGKKHVQLIDVAVENLRGFPSSLCVHNPLCGHCGCIEANGDVYSCDRYAFPAYYLGNIIDTELKILMEMNKEFGLYKTYGLSNECFECPYIKLCLGGCPKDRVNNGRNYLCNGYKLFFRKFVGSLNNC